MSLNAFIFDLDGVITDTAKYHYQAWKTLADAEGICFDSVINERLKGVSRSESLEIILERANKSYTDAEKADMLRRKNDIYVELLNSLTPRDILPGIQTLIALLKKRCIKRGLYSASKNTMRILGSLNAASWFDAIVTGEDVAHTKPDPEGFILAARRLDIQPADCAVIEDAFSGIAGGNDAGMFTIGVGSADTLFNARVTVSTTGLLPTRVASLLDSGENEEAFISQRNSISALQGRT